MRGIVCGATNFVEGDLVVVALPGAVLPGGFAITARKTYGRVSDGMICSARELGLGDEHSGILVLPSGEAGAGDDAVELLGLDDTIIELSITPDRGYAFSIRGLARELACAFDISYRDPAAIDVPEAEGDAVPITVEDAGDCPRFVARRVTGVDPTAPTPWWVRRRLMLAGIRSISLTVDVTNYVMLEMGQPMHAFDTPSLRGAINIRRAKAGETLTTLDDVERKLDPDDIVVADDSGADLARRRDGRREHRGEARQHRHPARGRDLGPGVDRALGAPAQAAVGGVQAVRAARGLERAADRVGAGGAAAARPRGRQHPARAHRRRRAHPDAAGDDADQPARPGGRRAVRAWRDRSAAQPDRLPHRGRLVRRRHPDRDGRSRRRGGRTSPSRRTWSRRCCGSRATTPSRPCCRPPRPATGTTASQRRRRAVGRALAEAGYFEVLPFPFVSPTVWDSLGLGPDDNRRRTVSVLNPLEADRSELATTLLPGLLDALVRNVSRGMRDVSLFNVGQVTLPKAQQVPVPDVGVADRPSDAEVASLHAALPQQPVHVAVVLAGNRTRAGWWGPGEPATWSDAVRAAQIVGEAAGVELTVKAGELAPWHPGRCAQLMVGDLAVGYAGELHPKVVDALGLPKRTCAMELKLDGLPLVDRRPAPSPSPYPPVLLDVALVVAEDVPVAEVADALRGGGGDLLEELHLFDVFTGEQVGEGKRSLAYSLRFRAPDRTLTVDEATAARDAAVSAAASKFGAALRS